MSHTKLHTKHVSAAIISLVFAESLIMLALYCSFKAVYFSAIN